MECLNTKGKMISKIRSKHQKVNLLKNRTHEIIKKIFMNLINLNIDLNM